MFDNQNVHKAFQSILRADYISINDGNQLEMLGKYYVDIYYLYAIDYEICRENEIIYAEVKDEFTAARFIYDSELAKYDCYFLKEAIKSYRCPICNLIYQGRVLFKKGLINIKKENGKNYYYDIEEEK